MGLEHMLYQICSTTHAVGEVGISLDSLDRIITLRGVSLSEQPGVTSTIVTVVIYIAIRVEREIGEDISNDTLYSQLRKSEINYLKILSCPLNI